MKYDEKYIKIKQARLDWSRLLAAGKYISGSAFFACDGWQRDISI